MTPSKTPAPRRAYQVECFVARNSGWVGWHAFASTNDLDTALDAVLALSESRCAGADRVRVVCPADQLADFVAAGIAAVAGGAP